MLDYTLEYPRLDGHSQTGLRSSLSHPEPGQFNFEVVNQQVPTDLSSKPFPSFFLTKGLFTPKFDFALGLQVNKTNNIFLYSKIN
jgi:hypothetical protein